MIGRGGTAFALVHNHPGGSLQPSRADRTATEQIRGAAEVSGLRFLDRLIIAGDEWLAVE